MADVRECSVPALVGRVVGRAGGGALAVLEAAAVDAPSLLHGGRTAPRGVVDQGGLLMPFFLLSAAYFLLPDPSFKKYSIELW